MRRTTFKAALLFSLAGSFGATLTIHTDALAQDDEAIVEARAKFQRAIELEHGKDWPGALKLFRQVGQVRMTPQVRYHIATCEENLGQLVVALAGYELALDQSEEMHPDFIQEVEASIDDLKGRIPKLIIERGVGAEAAAIELDGIALGANAIGVETPLNPGPHTVTATAPGFEPYRETVTVSEGGTVTIPVTLEEINTKPEVVPLPPPPKPEPIVEKKYGKLPYIIGGSGAGVTIAGIVFLAVAGGKRGKAKDACKGEDGNGTLDLCDLSGSGLSEADANKLISKTQTYEALGYVGLSLGIAGIATGTVLYFLDRGRAEPRSAALRISPSAPASDFGFSLSGSF